MKKITRTALQIIAIVTMTIDHSGKLFAQYGTWIFDVCCIIGRIAFPLFCFMIAEGSRHTRNIWKYLLRILVFAILIFLLASSLLLFLRPQPVSPLFS